ncbi:Hypothetical protein CAP_9057 [Chondromyces apiculatus DSM 436]|uniref:Uncharacterized protein n=1 Tax=Chondromyces apiculatus DSM 436 TaxID=1192034 RepID=A0A017SUW6_9BACT|nr:Hypothetical protein CAP_9057 [Chondromyces apiculatus DSM 436]
MIQVTYVTGHDTTFLSWGIAECSETGRRSVGRIRRLLSGAVLPIDPRGFIEG